jgi:hypothetical protein
MKNYFIRLTFGLFTIGIVLFTAYTFNIAWLLEGNPERLPLIVLIGIIGGWGGWYLYKGFKHKKV